MQISWVGRSTRCIYICRTIYVNLDKSASQWNPSYDSYYESGKWKNFRFRVFTMGHEKIFKAKQSFCGGSKEVSIECSSIEGNFKQWHSFTHFASLLFLASVSLIHSLFLASVSLINCREYTVQTESEMHGAIPIAHIALLSGSPSQTCSCSPTEVFPVQVHRGQAELQLGRDRLVRLGRQVLVRLGRQHCSGVNASSPSAASVQCWRNGRKVNWGGAEVYLSSVIRIRVNIAEESVVDHRVQLQCKFDEWEGK